MYRIIGIFLGLLWGDAFASGAEYRWGLCKNDIHDGLKYRHERGYNINVEYLFPSFKADIWSWILNPKVHVGTSVNLEGYTSHLYTGLTWIGSFRRLVIEPTFGAGLNNGKRTKEGHKRQRLGSHLLFRESLSLGYRLGGGYTVYGFVDHVSSAHLAHPNPGITTVGIRFGFIR